MHVKKGNFDSIPERIKGGKRFAAISDVHLGHPRTPTWWVIKTLNERVTNPVFMSDIDALFITGDLFDRLLNLPAVEVDELHDWIKRLLKLSVSCKTPIRILEGTPSHDWKQSAIINKMNETYGVEADVQYIEELSIVHDTSLNMVIGYVPDEWRESCDQTTEEFKDLLATHGYDKVDMLMMHGMFEFQIPKAAAKSISHFKESEWEPLVRHIIVIGHDHRHKSKGKIVVPSSWERLAQNEEEAKGCVLFDIMHNETEVLHLENAGAMWYKSVRASTKTDIETIKLVEEELHRFAELPEPYGRLKVFYNNKYDLSEKISEWKGAFVNVIVDASGESEQDLTTSDLDKDFKLSGETINITEDNIMGMILREADIPVHLKDAFSKEIESVMEAL